MPTIRVTCWAAVSEAPFVNEVPGETFIPNRVPDVTVTVVDAMAEAPSSSVTVSRTS